MNRQIVVLIDRQNTGILLDAVKRPATRICLQSGVSISVVKTLVNGGYIYFTSDTQATPRGRTCIITRVTTRELLAC